MISYTPKKRNIYVQMAKRGFNQRTLSMKSNIHPSTISNFMNGRYYISPTTATKLAEALGSEIEYLFEIQINQMVVNKNDSN